MSEAKKSGGEALLRVDDLRTHFYTDAGIARAVDGISFEIAAGECLALVGESGCGKSVTSLSIMKLLPMPPARMPTGRILFDGSDLVPLSQTEMCSVRGNEIAMIFQEPQSALNPVFTIGDQVAEAFTIHHPGTPVREAYDRAVESLKSVGIPDPERRMGDYPHQLSGGMKQRVCIAMALICNPRLLIADEPTTALDVTIQAQILELLMELQASRNLALLLITHDLGVVAEMAQRTCVMYAGKIVETASTIEVFSRPLHPYTQGLMRARPEPGSSQHGRKRLAVIPGRVPAATAFKDDCRFRPRCPLAVERCGQEPPLNDFGQAHRAACWQTKAEGVDAWAEAAERAKGGPGA
ncbi:MAG: ABC transporter ATP-binding protein [Planctomycetota bacterium]